MKYFLGVDQGGTKTIALVVDPGGNILGTGHEAGLISVYFDDKEGVFANRIRGAAEKACVAARISLSQVTAVCGCLNGADWDFEYPVLKAELQKALGVEDAVVLNDCVGGMRGGSASAACGVVCAGSGMNAAVRRADGKEIIYGYYVNGEHQGGGALGAAALRKVMEARLGICGETMLTGLILDFTGRRDAEELMIDLTVKGYELRHKDLAPALLKAYAAHDAEAADVVERFARGTSKYITAGMDRLGMSGEEMDLVLSGSVFKDIGTLVADRVFDYVSETEPRARKVHGRYEPVCGAALTLLDRFYRGPLPQNVVDAFDKTAESNGMLRNLDPTGGGARGKTGGAARGVPWLSD